MSSLFRLQEWFMDVVATPVGEDEPAWWLTDRRGHPLGGIRTIPGSNAVTIVPRTGGRLSSVPAHHASLDDALTTIGERVGGTCELNPI
ncbi:hypothetical protein [Methylobacterium nigriterrae]|uniref:hypothetical protein n=1 Tax=Methylobacterium nigriterrae TaxID=3127512 RepID=UPI0030140D67